MLTLLLAFCADPPDFSFFVNRVEPVSLKTREGSRRNFENVLKLIEPGQPAKSHLLLHPLAEEAGGEPFHAGGKFWKSKDDPEWRILAQWVNGAK